MTSNGTLSKRYMFQIVLPVCTVLLPLIAGVALYWVFRGICIAHVAAVLPYSPHHGWLTDFIKYSLPDGLWLYALLEGLRLVWKSALFKKGMVWVYVVSVGAIGSEVAQYAHLIPGTFDFNDIAAYGLAVGIFLIPYRNFFYLQPNLTTI